LNYCRLGAIASVFVTLVLVACLSPAQQRMQEGDIQLGRQEWDDAVVSYSLAMQLDPGLKLEKKIAAAYAGKASASFEQRDYPSAVYNFDKALSLDPQVKAGFDVAYARYRYGLDCMENGRNEDALQALGAAIEGGYAEPEAYLARARVSNLLGLYSMAIGDASSCLDRDPQSAGAYLERGYAYLATGEYGKATKDLSQAIALDSTLKGAYYYRGLAFKQMGEFRQAIDDLKLASEADPSSVAALIELGRCYYLNTDYYDAIEQFSRAVGLDKDEAAVAFNDRAVSLGRVGQFNEAVSDLGILTGLYPAFPLAYYNLGVLYMKMNQPPAGIDNLDIYLCLDLTDRFGCRGLASGWRQYNIWYNVCCGSRAMSADAVERCHRLLNNYRDKGSVSYEAGALYFGTENDLFFDKWHCRLISH